MKRNLSLILFTCCSFQAFAQKFITESSTVSFFSHASIEDIAAANKKATGIFNTETMDVAFAIPITEFEFAKSLMKEHFNEKYMESDKFSKSTFQGKVSGYSNSGNGIQDVKATGKLTIHGVTKDVTLPGTIEKKDGNLIMKSKFIVKLQDYKIAIPQLLWKNIAEQVEVTVEFTFKPQ